MRPTPTTRHLAAVVIFAALSIAFGLLAMRETRISTAQAHLATAALKDHDPSLYTHDPIYGNGGLWQLNTPIFQSLLKLSLVPSGYADVVLPFRLMTGVVAMIYLCGMYSLLFQQCRSWSVAAYVAVASAAVLEAIPGLKWGFGSLATTEPETLTLAVLPLVMLAYLHYERQWRVVFVFAFLGLMGNLSLPMAMNLVIILAVTYVLRGRFSKRSVGLAVLGVLAALVAAMPYLAYALWMRHAAAGGQAVDYDAAREAMEAAGLNVMYPRVLMTLLNWRLLVMLVVLGVPSILVLVRVERYRVRHETAWLWWMAAAIVVGFGLHGLSQAAGKWMDGPPPVLGFFSALKLVMLPLFVLLAQALTNLFRLVRRHKEVLQWIGVVAMVAWLGPSENLRVARYAAWDAATSFLPEARKPRSVIRHQRRAARHDELMAVAQWTRDHSDTEAVFLTNNVIFRMAGRRSIVASHHDFPYFYRLAPSQLPAWMANVRSQASVLYPPAKRGDPVAIANMVDHLASQDVYEGASEWYILLDEEALLESASPLKEISGEGWGRFYRLYRVR